MSSITDSYERDYSSSEETFATAKTEGRQSNKISILTETYLKLKGEGYSSFPPQDWDSEKQFNASSRLGSTKKMGEINPRFRKALLITGIVLLALISVLIVGLSVQYTVGWQHAASTIKHLTVKDGLLFIATPSVGLVLLTVGAILLIKYLIKKQNDLKHKKLFEEINAVDEEVKPVENEDNTPIISTSEVEEGSSLGDHAHSYLTDE